MFATHGHSPCSAASASERTDCLPAQSFRNSSGISLSRLLSRTPGQTCVHVVSSFRADVDTCSSQQTQWTGLPFSVKTLGRMVLRRTHSPSQVGQQGYGEVVQVLRFKASALTPDPQGSAVPPTLKCASSMADKSLGTTFSTSLKASGLESTSSCAHTSTHTQWVRSGQHGQQAPAQLHAASSDEHMHLPPQPTSGHSLAAHPRVSHLSVECGCQHIHRVLPILPALGVCQHARNSLGQGGGLGRLRLHHQGVPVQGWPAG